MSAPPLGMRVATRPVLRPLSRGLDPSRFFARVARAKKRVLMLDFDGTLAPFAARPECVRPYPRIPAALDRIMAQPGSRVVIVTGRRLDGAAPALALAQTPEIWGAHGWQRMAPGGQLAVYEPSEAVREKLDAALVQAMALRSWGARVEPKPGSVAVHWRGQPVLRVQALREELERRWRGVRRSPELELVDFDGGVELRALGRDKGVVVNRVLVGAGEETAAAYLGDDTTDEDAFLAIEGRGLGILVRAQLRRTRADAWLRPPHELAAFLEQWCACGEPV